MFEDSNTRWMKQYGNVYSMVSDFRTVIMHEVGHYVDAKTKRALYDAVQAMDLSIKNEAYSISGYASSDRFRMQLPGAEMVAEVLCAYFSDNPKFLTLPDEVQAAVKTLLK